MSILIADDDKGPMWHIDELYGRKDELELLNKLSDEASSSCVLIQGASGSGKTELLRSIPWDDKNWVYVEGKFEKEMCMEPYSALIRILDDLVEIWLENNKVAPVCQLSSFRKVLEEDIELLKDVVPGMFRIVGRFAHELKYTKMRSIRNLTEQYSKHHVTEEFKMGAESTAISGAFLRLFSFLSSSRPIVLFLDDIHFADAPSMEIVELIAHNTAHDQIQHSSHMLLALSYSSDLMSKNKFASRTVESIKTFESSVHALELEDFDVDALNELVASVVGSNKETTLPLSRVILKKTAGNPFAVAQFLRYTRMKGFFTFSPMTFSWQWGDVEMLDEYAMVSDNVAEIVAMSMENLCIPARIVLKVSSCLGKVIPIDVLVEYFKEENEGSELHLSCPEVVGVKEYGLQTLLADATKLGILVKSKTQGAFMWSNDRLQDVAYSFIPEDFRPVLHRNLGQLLWRLGLENDEEWMIFMAANQMNRFADLMGKECALGNEVAKLNLQAAMLSLNKAALYPALELLEKAEKHMNMESRWAESYNLTLDLLTHLAETKAELGEVEDALDVAGQIVSNAKSLNDQFRAYVVLLKGRVSGEDRDYAVGVEKTLELLKLYGEKHPKKFYPGQKCVEKAKLKKLLPGGELEGLLDLPDMVDETALAIQILLVDHLALYAGFSAKHQKLGWFASVRALKHACKLGVSPVTNMAVLNIAMHLRLEGHYKEASQYADFALKLSERIPHKPGSNHGLVRGMACSSVFGAVRSFNNCLNEMVESRSEALKAGKAKSAVGASLAYSSVYLNIGLPLAPLEEDLKGFAQDAKQFGSPYTMKQIFLIFCQAILNLRNDVENPTLLTGEAMDQEKEIEKVKGNGRRMTLRDINTNRLMLCCVYGDWDTAEVVLDALEEHVDAKEIFIFRVHFRRCYLGLAGFALSRKCKTAKKRKKYQAIGKKMLKMFTTDMKYGSVNAYPIVSMLEAEESPSKEKYDKAIKACARLGLVHHEAYMCERAGDFFVEKGDDNWSEFYFGQAVLLYGEWGATGKAEKLTDDNSHLLSRSSLRESVNTSLQGRSRYSSKELDSLRVIDWERFSVGSH